MNIQVLLYQQHQECLLLAVVVVYQLWLIPITSCNSSNNNSNDGDECYRKNNDKCNCSNDDPVSIVPLSITGSSMGQYILAILVVCSSL